MKTIINRYIVVMDNNNTFDIYASNLAGAKAQVANIAGVTQIIRVFACRKSIF